LGLRVWGLGSLARPTSAGSGTCAPRTPPPQCRSG
jgi:hypothetical protein